LCQLQTRPQFVMSCDRLQTLHRSFVEWSGRVVEEIGVGSITATPNTATQLMQLRQPVTVGVFDDQRIRIRDVQARFNDGGGNQNVIFFLPEVHHDLFERGF